MAEREQGRAAPTSAAQIGVATTTVVAFTHAGKLFLERMNIIAEDGAGVLCAEPPPVGAELQLVFRLSTARQAIRAEGRVEALVATTPAGVELHRRLGDREFKAAIGAAIGDSATAIFRASDLEGSRARRPSRPPPAAAQGFSVRFTSLDPAGVKAVRRHVGFSLQLRQQLAARGEQLVETAPDERPTLASYFDEGNLSERAKDW